MSNPLLDRLTTPGETFQLPSQGLLYTNGELDESVSEGEVYVNPMTTIDEVYMKTPDKLLNGTAIEQVLRNCVPTIKKPLELFSNDVDFILTCIRKVTYGDIVHINYKHSCKDAKSHEYAIDIGDFIKYSKKMDPTALEAIYTIKLDNGQLVKFTPIRYKSLIKVYQSIAENTDDPITIAHNLTEVITEIISEVDGITDKKMIEEWLTKLRVDWVNNIQQTVEQTSNWGASFTKEITCKDCNQTVKLTAPLNPINFFS